MTPLDRWVHLSNEAELPPVLSRRLRRDFDRVELLEKERRHLSVLDRQTAAQRARMEIIGRQLADAPDPGWTRRRMSEQADELLALAYRRHVDRAFRRLLEEVWSISLAELTPAWRDASRFYLAVDKNRDLLGTVLKLAARHPGEEISARLPENASWLERAAAKLKVERWLAARSREITIGARGARSLCGAGAGARCHHRAEPPVGR
jgi:hypothetical protein